TDLWSEARARGFADALTARLAPDGRVYRVGEPPAAGPAEVEALIGDESDVQWEPRGGSVGETGDLAYTYGTSVITPREEGATKKHRAYLRIWERLPEGDWRVVVDLTNPIREDAGRGE
ncbi:MAG: DUF4440 domain-containing protein, partial [Candidatus Eisenbacteria bacterium]|nr:DUF4440 domain-containing protein [Candidatus Eisenbacteria bacterium]